MRSPSEDRGEAARRKSVVARRCFMGAHVVALWTPYAATRPWLPAPKRPSRGHPQAGGCVKSMLGMFALLHAVVQVSSFAGSSNRRLAVLLQWMLGDTSK